MKTAIEILRELGVSFRGSPRRSFKTVCPKCSHGRKNKSDPCLSVRVDETGVGTKCFNCGWSSGKFFDANAQRSTIKTLKKTPIVRYSDMLARARSNWR